QLDAQGELRLQGQALRARGAPAAARAPPRLEGDLLGRGARGADGTRTGVGPAVDAPRAVRGGRGARSPDAAPGRRPRRVPRRRPAREARPRVDGVVARGARPVPRPRPLELRLFTAVVAARPPAREEAPPPSRARAAAAARGRARPQARLLDSCGRV